MHISQSSRMASMPKRRLTGEGFSHEKTLAYLTFFLSAVTLTVMIIDYFENSQLRKITKELTEEQLKEIKGKNGSKKA